jgi:hypothetical protein
MKGRTAVPEITRTAAEVAAILEDGKEVAFLDVRGGLFSSPCQGSKRSANLRDGFHFS